MRPESLAELKNLLVQETGLFFPPEKDYLLVSAVEKRLRLTQNPSPERYIKGLMANPEEFQELVNLLTIPETYFMREFPFLDLAARVIVPRIISERDEAHVLSAGSATGEEAYSLIMLALHYNLPMDKIDVLGVDINTRSIMRAKQGVFGQFSMRHADEPARSIVSEFAIPGANGQFSLPDKLRGLVRFEFCNLLKGLGGLGPFDLVLLRNTLIYIQPGLRAKVLMNIRDAMSDGAYLILGQVEIPGGTFGIFSQERLEGLTIFVKKGQIK
ncbi:MAG: CheR family methyltransferase [candidate division WOR-3 bacterium]